MLHVVRVMSTFKNVYTSQYQGGGGGGGYMYAVTAPTEPSTRLCPLTNFRVGQVPFS